MHNFFLLAGTDVYIPFTLDLNPEFSQFPVGMYVRAVAKTAPAAGGNKGKLEMGWETVVASVEFTAK